MRLPHSLRPLALLLLALLLGVPQLRAQDFDRALNLYQQQQYQEAAAHFGELPGERARLFAGKSWFALGRYLRAKAVLEAVDSAEADPDVYREARYTAGLAYLQLEDFAGALETWQTLAQASNAELASDAEQRYSELLGYLTVNQRREAFRRTTSPQVRFDLVRTALGRVPWSTARVLAQTYAASVPEGEEGDRIGRLLDTTADSLTYHTRTSGTPPLRAPEGMVFDIGVALPLFPSDDSAFGVSQGLYYGYLMAVDDYNRQNPRVRAVLRHRNTGTRASADSVDRIMTDFAWQVNAEAILGPLFSEAAAPMASYAESYGIPLLAPLANSDSLNFDNPYVFQSNPTYATHGQQMARFAHQQLGLDTLAVMAESGTSGENAAYAFREEFERMGGKVSYFFSENLEATGYEITEYTRYFTADSAVIDSLHFHPVEAVYAPFTGQASGTLMELLMIDLNAMNPGIPVLGSPEWGTSDLPESRVGNRPVYFTESFYTDAQRTQVQEFDQRFRERFERDPNRFARIGYDAATYLLRTLGRVQNPALLKEELSLGPALPGLANTIRFKGGHVNSHVYFMRLGSGGEAITMQGSGSGDASN
ncbi:MAG: ABC transporter substrate-binding protein [Balneolaceae bacterium]|nr:ABC transporter substrate-binding protein [Balneolaceae bacterium]